MHFSLIILRHDNAFMDRLKVNDSRRCCTVPKIPLGRIPLPGIISEKPAPDEVKTVLGTLKANKEICSLLLRRIPGWYYATDKNHVCTVAVCNKLSIT